LPSFPPADLAFLLSSLALSSHTSTPSIFAAAEPYVVRALANQQVATPHLASLALSYAVRGHTSEALASCMAHAAVLAAPSLQLDAFSSLAFAFAVRSDERNAERLIAAAEPRFAAASFYSHSLPVASEKARGGGKDALSQSTLREASGASEVEEGAALLPANFPARQLVRLRQWSLWWEGELGRAAVALPAEVRRCSANALVESESARFATAPSIEWCGDPDEHAAQRQRVARVSYALSTLGLPHLPELQLDSGYIIDLALPDHRVALLVGGKAHHDRLPGADGTHPPKAATRLRWRQVGAMGWKLISVPFYEWDALSDPVARRGYLRRKLLALLPLRLEA